MGKFDPNLLHKYLKNQCTDKEISEVLDWLDTAEGQKYYAEIIDAGIGQIDDKIQFLPNHQVDSREILNKIYKTIDTGPHQQAKNISLNPVKQARHYLNEYMGNWHKAAAVLGGLIFLATVYFLLFQFQNTTTYITAYGETKTIELPDNSQVVMNGNSILKFSSKWENKENREVWLEGEAYFSVVHTKSNQKFIVKTSENFNIEVLGTEFNIFKRERGTRVVLNSGKVKINIENEMEVRNISLEPGEMIEFLDKDAAFSKKIVNPEMYTSWRNKKLTFDHTSIQEIKSILEETYGLTVQVSDQSLLDKNVSGSAPSNSLDILLDGLSESVGLKITRINNLIIIDKNNLIK
jgi:ferric-dicitrate binding protein FerR (iron transport regulator)